MVVNGASRINVEFGIQTPFLDQVSEDSFSSWASADVAQAHKEHRERFDLCLWVAL
jgi:hypothetical protein